jgi:hypothetical protein
MTALTALVKPFEWAYEDKGYFVYVMECPETPTFSESHRCDTTANSDYFCNNAI